MPWIELDSKILKPEGWTWKYLGDNEWHLAPGHIFDVPKAVRVRNNPKEIAEQEAKVAVAGFSKFQSQEEVRRFLNRTRRTDYAPSAESQQMDEDAAMAKREEW
eukprot:CAMPEP_0119040306 /NCGR_PEP_ID=MMETSP1177-20130426/10190_1 /TAXON_ID=2985 /ORGANISM="Ochromonas sp, Strain CCMP1899" /LENGTH=103 /DNA_ID=CAMNT_0007005225 /DNA_START=33 /DNA_END=341 /DNA_ORIENTATION=+